MSTGTTRAASLPIVVTLWPSRSRPYDPQRRTMTWARFVEHFVANPEPSATKESVAGYALATFTGRRALATVEAVHALTLDFDDGRTSLDDAARLFPRTVGVVYTTYSSTPRKPKLRLIIPFSRPVTADEYASIWRWAHARCTRRGHAIDASTKDPSRLWYIPSCPLDCTSYEWRELRGRVLDVERVLRAAPRPVLPASPPTTARAPAGRKDGAARAPASSTLLGRAFELADMEIGHGARGEMFVRCPWEKRHTSGGDSTSSVVFPSTSARRLGHFHCLHDGCAHRTARDVLRALPRDAVARARREIGIEERVRVTVVRAGLDVRPAWDGRPPLVRWRLDLATRDGEILHGNVTCPTPGYEQAATVFGIVFPRVQWTAALTSYAEWQRRGLSPRGLTIDVDRRGAEITSWVRVIVRKPSRAR